MTKNYKKTIDILTNEALPKREKEFSHLKAKLLIKETQMILKKLLLPCLMSRILTIKSIKPSLTYLK